MPRPSVPSSPAEPEPAVYGFTELTGLVSDWQRVQAALRAHMARPRAYAARELADTPAYARCELFANTAPRFGPTQFGAALDQRRSYARGALSTGALERIKHQFRLPWPLVDEAPHPEAFAPDALSGYETEDADTLILGRGLRNVAANQGAPVGYLFADLSFRCPRLTPAGHALAASRVPGLAAADDPRRAAIRLELELLHAYLLPQHRGKGVAHALARAAARELVDEIAGLRERLAPAAGEPCLRELEFVTLRVSIAPAARTVSGWRLERAMRQAVAQFVAADGPAAAPDGSFDRGAVRVLVPERGG